MHASTRCYREEMTYDTMGFFFVSSIDGVLDSASNHSSSSATCNEGISAELRHSQSVCYSHSNNYKHVIPAHN